MQILAIESSSLTAGAAIIKDDVVLAEYSVSFKKTHSQTLLPMIDEVVKMTSDAEREKSPEPPIPFIIFLPCTCVELTFP